MDWIIGVVVCFSAQAGSSDMSIAVPAGAVPVKLTVPLTVAAMAGSTAGAAA
jgi:hypothetical protein